MKKTALWSALMLAAATIVVAGEKLEIVKAEYGAKDKWTDVTATVKAKVVNDSLKIEANNALCKDPAPGIPKMLKIIAKAGDKQAEFRCDERKTIQIDAKQVAEIAAVKANPVTIISAVYGAGDKTADVTDKVKAIVDKGTIHLSATNALFGDPAHGQGKVLTVKYKVGDEEKTVKINENQSADLR